MAEADASPEEKWATTRMAVLGDLTDEMAAGCFRVSSGTRPQLAKMRLRTRKSTDEV
jgi:hypothetical protein